MTLRVSANHPEFPKDYEFGVDGIGRIPNGGSVTLTEEQEEAYFQANGVKVRDAFKKSSVIKVEGSSDAKISGGGES